MNNEEVLTKGKDEQELYIAYKGQSVGVIAMAISFACLSLYNLIVRDDNAYDLSIMIFSCIAIYYLYMYITLKKSNHLIFAVIFSISTMMNLFMFFWKG